jgi:NDP-sugar pyrophosphorylase family protein
LSWLATSGIETVVYCIGYLGNEVRDFVGDGARWGLKVGYVDEGAELRGTAGALRLALDEGALDEEFLVLYGDSWLQVDPASVLRYARGRSEPALMTVFRNEGLWDTSNVVFDGDLVARYEKGLDPRPEDMRWIDYGLTALRRELIASRVPPQSVQDLAPLCTALARERQLAGYEVTARFYEIGSVEGRDELERFLKERR